MKLNIHDRALRLALAGIARSLGAELRVYEPPVGGCESDEPFEVFFATPNSLAPGELQAIAGRVSGAIADARMEGGGIVSVHAGTIAEMETLAMWPHACPACPVCGRSIRVCEHCRPPATQTVRVETLARRYEVPAERGLDELRAVVREVMTSRVTACLAWEWPDPKARDLTLLMVEPVPEGVRVSFERINYSGLASVDAFVVTVEELAKGWPPDALPCARCHGTGSYTVPSDYGGTLFWWCNCLIGQRERAKGPHCVSGVLDRGGDR